MKHFRLFLLVLCLSACTGLVQAQTTSTSKTDAILKNARTLDLLNHILPLVLTKAQINELLPAIEKCRARVRQIEKMEADDLSKFDAKIAKAVEDGLNKDQVPSKELLREVATLFNAFNIRRNIAIGENLEEMMAVVKRVFNAGQLKTAQNSLDPKAFNPTGDVKALSDDDKLKLYIREILLDPLSYDFLVRLSKIKS